MDLAAVPNYTDVISRPMDLGTMTTKVERGKYRSLEEFAVRLPVFAHFGAYIQPLRPKSPIFLSQLPLHPSLRSRSRTLSI